MGMSLVMLKNVLDVCAGKWVCSLSYLVVGIYSGYKTRELKADETLAPCPGGTYDDKFLCETLLRHYHQHYGVAYALLRSSPVYGPGSDRPKFIWNFLRRPCVMRRLSRTGTSTVSHPWTSYTWTIFARPFWRQSNVAPGRNQSGDCMQTIHDRDLPSASERAGITQRIRHHDISAIRRQHRYGYQPGSRDARWRPEIDLARGWKNIIRVGLMDRFRHRENPVTAK